MKKVIYFILCSFTVLINISCEGMDENYKDYRDEHPTYSPAVTEVNAISPEAGSLTLTWTFPKTDRIKSVEIVYKESSTKSESVEVGMKTSILSVDYYCKVILLKYIPLIYMVIVPYLLSKTILPSLGVKDK